ncbi:hypothetical protein COOONC_12285 [Cooperia oncophora]
MCDTKFQILVFASTKEYCEFTDAVVLPRDLPPWHDDLPGSIQDVQHELDDTLLLPFSSGTGGKPRCVTLTHRNYNAATAILKMALFDQLVVESRRKTVAVLPFYHASGFWALLYCLLEGCHTIIMKSFHPISMLEIIHKYELRGENGGVVDGPYCPGELYLKSPTVMRGYHNSDGTADPFVDGWLRTGERFSY